MLGRYLESMRPILNCCKESQIERAKRHDKLVNKMEQELQSFWVEIHTNKTMHISINELKDYNFQRGFKPNLVRKTKKCLVLLNVACPHYLYMEELWLKIVQNTKR